jgi:hypothetical protein
MGLPHPLVTAITSRIKHGGWVDRPRIVALGADSNFLLLTEKNAAVWDLNRYHMLGRMLEYSQSQDRGIEELDAVVLHPFRYQCFIAKSRNGMVISGNIPLHEMGDLEAVMEIIKRDAEAKAEREGVEAEKARNVGGRRLSQQATLRREWSNRKDELRKEAGEYKHKLKLSLTLNISAGGIARMLG